MTEMKPHILEECFSLRARIGWQGLRAEEFKDFGPYLVTGTDFKNGKVDWDTCYHVTEERYAQDKGIQLKEHDLLVTKDGTVGKTAFVVDCPAQTTLNSHIFLVRSTDGSVLPEYLYYILNSQAFSDFMSNALTGTTIKGLTQEKFYKFTFKAPSVPEQHKIAEVLMALDEVIDRTREIIEKYRNVKKGLMLRLLKCERKVALSTLGDIIAGSTPSTSEAKYWDGNAVWLTPADLSKMDTPFISDSGRRLSELGIKKATGTLLPENSFLMSTRAPVGYCAIVTCPFSFNQGCKALKARCNVDSLYLYYYFSDKKEELESVSSGTTFLELSKKEFERFPVAIPENKDVQKEISTQILSVDEKIISETKVYDKYMNIKLGLLQDLLSGRVDVTPLM